MDPIYALKTSPNSDIPARSDACAAVVAQRCALSFGGAFCLRVALSYVLDPQP